MIGATIEYHDDTRQVITYMFDEVYEIRPYTEAEIAESVARATQQANAQSLSTDAASAITTLLTAINDLQVIIDKTNATIGPADTKNVARSLKSVARQLIRLTRLTTNKLDTTDVGTA